MKEKAKKGVTMQFRHGGSPSAFWTQPVTHVSLATGAGPSVYVHIRLSLSESGHTQKKLKCFNSWNTCYVPWHSISYYIIQNAEHHTVHEPIWLSGSLITAKQILKRQLEQYHFQHRRHRWRKKQDSERYHKPRTNAQHTHTVSPAH